ncbi:hypothetical protein CY35_03G054100 [Sphagnum magellanicum]|nr:hypothetical protein CY35_03G054100 [Sphagnum magellanicum]
MVEIEMVLKVREVGESLDTLFKHEDCQDREAVLIRASFSNVGESLVGGLTLGSKRAAVYAEPSNTSCPSATLMLSTSPSKATVASSHASSVSSQPIPIVLQEKHICYRQGTFGHMARCHESSVSSPVPLSSWRYS